MIATARDAFVALINPAASGAAVNWSILPINQPLPAIRLTIISDIRGASHAGADGLSEAIVQCDVFGDDPAEIQGIRDAIVTALHGLRTGPFRAILHEQTREDVDADGTHEASADFRIIYGLS